MLRRIYALARTAKAAYIDWRRRNKRCRGPECNARPGEEHSPACFNEYQRSAAFTEYEGNKNTAYWFSGGPMDGKARFVGAHITRLEVPQIYTYSPFDGRAGTRTHLRMHMYERVGDIFVHRES